jgi:hypothetical protein
MASITTRLANEGATDQIDSPTRVKSKTDVIKATEFAGQYRSTLSSLEFPFGRIQSLLKHVNCSYLSPPNYNAPTLLNLKQHAQALTILIRQFGVSTKSGQVNHGEFNEHEIYDWLNDLDKVYENDEEDHNTRLSAVVNQLADGLKPNPELVDERDSINICPLHQTRVPGQDKLPYANLQALIVHANEILERLDHEHSYTGGILGILPDDDELGDDFMKEIAEKSVLGQWLTFTRALVMKVHELERGFANALEVLAGEAIVPRELLSDVGTIGRKGDRIAYPQDRFVLAGIRDHDWKWLTGELDQKAANQSLEFVSLDIPTRYYRAPGQRTIFVVPDFADKMKVLKQIEERPTVVQVVKPTWPERASVWERKHKEEMNRLSILEPEVMCLRAKVKQQENDLLVMQHERNQYEVERGIWKRNDPQKYHLLRDLLNAKAESERIWGGTDQDMQIWYEAKERELLEREEMLRMKEVQLKADQKALEEHFKSEEKRLKLLPRMKDFTF